MVLTNQCLGNVAEKVVRRRTVFPVIRVLALLTSASVGDNHVFTAAFATHAYKYLYVNPYPTAFPYGNGVVLHFYQQQESSTTKTVQKVINKRLKTYVESPYTGENFH